MWTGLSAWKSKNWRQQMRGRRPSWVVVMFDRRFFGRSLCCYIHWPMLSLDTCAFWLLGHWRTGIHQAHQALGNLLASIRFDRTDPIPLHPSGSFQIQMQHSTTLLSGCVPSPEMASNESRSVGAAFIESATEVHWKQKGSISSVTWLECWNVIWYQMSLCIQNYLGMLDRTELSHMM